MTAKEQDRLFGRFCSEHKITKDVKRTLHDILKSKRNDYSNNDDVLLSFKRASDYSLLRFNGECSFSPSEICKALICVKLARIENVTELEVVNHESLSDSITDLILYYFLLKCIEKDMLKKQK